MLRLKNNISVEENVAKINGQRGNSEALITEIADLEPLISSVNDNYASRILGLYFTYELDNGIEINLIKLGCVF